MTDHESRPVWVQVFEGNTTDQTSVLDQIKLLRNTLGIQGFVLVDDRGMLTESVIEDIVRRPPRQPVVPVRSDAGAMGKR